MSSRICGTSGTKLRNGPREYMNTNNNAWASRHKHATPVNTLTVCLYAPVKIAHIIPNGGNIKPIRAFP